MISQNYSRPEIPDHIPGKFASCSFLTKSSYITFKLLEEISFNLFAQMSWANKVQELQGPSGRMTGISLHVPKTVSGGTLLHKSTLGAFITLNLYMPAGVIAGSTPRGSA